MRSFAILVQTATEGGEVSIGKVVRWTAGISGLAGFLYTIDPNVLVQHMSIIAQSQIAQAGFFFTLAAWLHAGRVKKEINGSFSTLITALNSLSDALRKELQIHSEQLAEHANKLANLEKSVKAIVLSPKLEPTKGENNEANHS